MSSRFPVKIPVMRSKPARSADDRLDRRHHRAVQHRFPAEGQGQVVGAEEGAVHAVDAEDVVEVVQARAGLDLRQQQRLVARAEQGDAGQALAAPPLGREVSGPHQVLGLAGRLDRGDDHAVDPGVQHPRQLRPVVRRQPDQHRHRADPGQRGDISDIEIAVLDIDPDPVRAATARHLQAERAQERQPQPPPARPAARAHLPREAGHAAPCLAAPCLAAPCLAAPVSSCTEQAVGVVHRPAADQRQRGLL